MKKTISLLLTAIMVFSLVPALFVRDGVAAEDIGGQGGLLDDDGEALEGELP